MIWILIAAIVIIDLYMLLSARKIKIPKKRYRTLTRKEMEEKIYNMHWREFEEFIAELFQARGDSVILTPPEADGGVDIIVNNEIYIECKHWAQHNLVGRPEVQKLLGKCVEDNIKKAIFVTTSSYTIEAIECAKKVEWIDIQLWDMVEILRLAEDTDSDTVIERA